MYTIKVQDKLRKIQRLIKVPSSLCILYHMFSLKYVDWVGSGGHLSESGKNVGEKFKILLGFPYVNSKFF